MRYMNDYDLHCARTRFIESATPNRLALVMVVDNLREWADENSDGWAYWPKPARAADKAMALIESRTSRENDEQERHDITDAEMLAAVRPIKAFLSRQGVSAERREVILRAVTV
jgi:hypothetical protein